MVAGRNFTDDCETEDGESESMRSVFHQEIPLTAITVAVKHLKKHLKPLTSYIDIFLKVKV